MLLPSHYMAICHFFTQLPPQGKSEGFGSCDWPSKLNQIGLKSSINQPMWPWNLMNDIEKLQGASSILHQTLCIISIPLVYSNWSYSPEMLNWVKIDDFCPAWPWKIIGRLFYTTLSFVQYFKTIGIYSNLSYSLETLNSGKNLRFFCTAWPWKWTYDLEKQ